MAMSISRPMFLSTTLNGTGLAVPYLLPIAGTLFGAPVFIGSIVISALIVLLYFLCYLFSKNRNVLWLVTALALFCVDTILMLVFNFAGAESMVGNIIDMLLHAWVIISLCGGIAAHKKLKALPDEPVAPVVEAASEEAPAPEQNAEE